MNERIEELIPFYSLGGLTQTEKTQMETHLGQNPAAQAQLADDLWATTALVYGTWPIKPPLRLKRELMDRVKQDSSRLKSQEPVSSTSTSSTGFWEWLRRSLSGNGPALVMAGLSLLLILGIGAWANSLGRQLEQLQQANVALERQLTGQTETLTELNQQVAPLQAENADLKRQLTGQTDALAALNKQIPPLQAENAALKRELAGQADQLAWLDAAMASLPSPDSATIEVIAALKSELAAQQEVLASLNEQIEQVQAVNAVLVQELSTQRAIMAEVTTPNVQIMAMTGNENLPQSSGQLIANPNASKAVVLVSGLPRLQPGFFYQFWLVQDGTPVRAGVLDVDEAGLGVLQVNADSPIGTYEAMGLSIEPVNSTSDTHDMIMLGTVSS
jgi:uncharacterized coiled-coil protein SlyX